MANDVFALSPMSANGTLPSEADYNAISEAFMETARGRWFLKEYTRRNRNADTAVVLEAVARIESNIAAQKRQGPVTGLAGAMTAIQDIVDNARAEASKAIEQLSSDETIAPSRKGVRVIREVAWRLREIGYDGRICDILEEQANAVSANHDAPAAQQTHDAVLAAFDEITRQIGKLADNGFAAPSPAENVVSLTMKPQVQPSQEPVLQARTTTPDSDNDKMLELSAEVETTLEAPTEYTVAAEPSAVLAVEAVLSDLIEAAETKPVAKVLPSSETPLSPETSSPETSLGEALLARGVVATPDAAKSNPLASIRRMSQAEKVAFFS
jgi:hypothetical protein